MARPSASRLLLIAIVFISLSGLAVYEFGRPLWVPVYYKMMGKRTVDDVVSDIGPMKRADWTAYYGENSISYPPESIVLVALKDERKLEVWLPEAGVYRLVKTYDVLGASGKLGPKLREGDLQVPEGVYAVEGLNPNSAFHLSMKLDYPNAFDREMGEAGGRDNLGTDIFIHGKRASVGCLAMGDEAIEELFVIVADTGIENVTVIVAPYDMRVRDEPIPEGLPDWTAVLYAQINEELVPFSAPPEESRASTR